MTAYHDQLVPESDDKLWTATTDDRIKAVVMMAPCFAHVLGEAGIAAVKVRQCSSAGHRILCVRLT